MKAIFPSSLAQTETMRLTIQKSRTAMAAAEIEVSSGRKSDVGLAIGSSLSDVIDLRGLGLQFESIQQSNAAASTRLDVTQSALGAMGQLGNELFAAVAAVRQSGGERSVLLEGARSAMEQLLTLSKSTSGGAFVFSGVNTDTPPLDDYLSNPTGAARTAVQSAFAGLVAGVGGNAADIAGSDMASYLDTVFAAIFEDPSWGSVISSADERTLVNRISMTATAETSVTINNVAIRELYSALAAVLDSDIEALSADAFGALADRLGELATRASAGIARLQSSVGIMQERLAKATDHIVLEKSVLERSIGEFEGVDAYEAATRLMTLRNGLETSYSVTARLQDLSLLKFL